MSAPDTPPAEAALRLPLWKAAADDLLQEGFTYGSTVLLGALAQKLRAAVGTTAFHFALLALRKHLEEEFHLQTQTRRGLLIAHRPQEHAGVGLRMERKVVRQQKRALAVYRFTPREALSREEARRLDKLEEKAAIRLCLLRRAEQVEKALQRAQPDLLI